jgi:prefoldin subunit 5
VINTLRIYEELSQTLDPKAAHKLASVLGWICEDLQQTVTKTEFNDLREVVRVLAEAQQRTEAALTRLTERVDQLTLRVDQLTERVDQLTQRMDQLTQRVDQLALRMDQLAEQVGMLAQRLDDTNRQLGDLSMTGGYTLEDAACRALPALLLRDHGLHLTEPLRRDWLTDAAGRDLEVNILGRGRRGDETVWVVGEGKARLSRNDVDRFVKRRLEPLTPVLGKVFPVLITYMVTSRDVPQYAREQGVALYYSYQFNPAPVGAEPAGTGRAERPD